MNGTRIEIPAGGRCVLFLCTMEIQPGATEGSFIFRLGYHFKARCLHCEQTPYYLLSFNYIDLDALMHHIV